MRFIDANVFLNAILKPKKPTEATVKVKDAAVKIFNRFNAGEPTLTIVVHLSEVANVLEDAAGTDFAANFIRDVLLKPNLKVVSVTPEEYLFASELALKSKVGVNDAQASLTMRKHEISEAYSFDKHLDKLKVKRITLRFGHLDRLQTR